ncbi:hypothetical protein QTP70_024465 [Hemibagrus guttatus]|uniref:Reverse transcriptase domain-containing protein n=1 Tax=Hemibagrus guttatus TaxID=175788 RepID=A0AAE0VDC6_9TELE|nr:hypothetical protein QTP70_024465 [Hemibagrus guttatus]
MKCFERLVMRHIKTQLPPSLDPLQFVYRPKCSTDDAISTTLHLALTHLDNKGDQSQSRLGTACPAPPYWGPSALRAQSTAVTHDCAAMHSSNHNIKFADDTTVVGLISKNDESAYREEVQQLTSWCKDNNLSLNVDKTKEMVVDFRRAQTSATLTDSLYLITLNNDLVFSHFYILVFSDGSSPSSTENLFHCKSLCGT